MKGERGLCMLQAERRRPLSGMQRYNHCPARNERHCPPNSVCASDALTALAGFGHHCPAPVPALGQLLQELSREGTCFFQSMKCLPQHKHSPIPRLRVCRFLKLCGKHIHSQYCWAILSAICLQWGICGTWHPPAPRQRCCRCHPRPASGRCAAQSSPCAPHTACTPPSPHCRRG